MDIIKNKGLMKPLTAEESDLLWAEVDEEGESLGKKLLRLYLGRCWEAYTDEHGVLLYKDFKTCARAKCQRTFSTVYEHLQVQLIKEGLDTAAEVKPTLRDYLDSIPKEHLLGVKDLPDATTRMAALELASAMAHDRGRERPTATMVKVASDKIAEVLATKGAVSVSGQSFPINPLLAAAHEGYQQKMDEIKDRIDAKRQWRWHPFPVTVAHHDGFTNQVTVQLGSSYDFTLFLQLMKEAEAKKSFSIQERIKPDETKPS